jgi:hypothetical protein
MPINLAASLANPPASRDATRLSECYRAGLGAAPASIAFADSVAIIGLSRNELFGDARPPPLRVMLY